MTKMFKTIEILNIVEYITNIMKEEQHKALPTKVRWALKKNIDKLSPITKSYADFRQKLVRELQEEWFTDERSEEYIENKVDADGKPVIGENGAQETETMKRIKKQYMEDYEKAVSELNRHLTDVVMEENKVDVATFDMDAFVDSLPDDSPIDFDCLNILCFMDETTNVVKGA